MMEQEIDYVNSQFDEDSSLEYAKCGGNINCFFDIDYLGHSATQITKHDNNGIKSMSDSLNSNLSSLSSNKIISYSVSAEIEVRPQECEQYHVINENNLNCALNTTTPTTMMERSDTNVEMNDMKQVQFKYETISNVVYQESSSIMLHGEIPIRKCDIFDITINNPFMKGDYLSQCKLVNCITQTNNYLHIQLSQVEESPSAEFTEVFSQWQTDIIKDTQKWINQVQNEDTHMYSSYDEQNTLSNHSQQELLDSISHYIKTVSNYRSYFYQNQHLVDIYTQTQQSQERFDNINKRAFKILKQCNNNETLPSKTYMYKVVRKTPFEYTTLSRGISNTFFDQLGLDKQEVSQYIIRNHNLPFASEVNSSERIRDQMEEIVSHNNQQRCRNYKRILSIGDMSVQAYIQQQIFPLNQQLGDQYLDINDYLIIDFITFHEQESTCFAQKMKANKLQFGYCFTSSDFHYQTMSSNIVDRYYQNYSEQQRQENQILRLLNKKNHRFH